LIDRVLQLDLVPYLCVLPDIVGGGEESLETSLAWYDRLPRDLPWYLAVQDGMTPTLIEPYLDNYPLVGLFLGGTNGFKGSALAWSLLAHKRGMKFHYGRAGTLKKVRYAKFVKADSIDSALPLWTRERFNNFVEYVGGRDPQHDWIS